MLETLFIIFMFQLVGEAAQKMSGLPVPGPVIGLILMLSFLLFTKNKKSVSWGIGRKKNPYLWTELQARCF